MIKTTTNWTSTHRTAPCYGCTNAKPCKRSECSSWGEFKALKDEFNKLLRTERAARAMFTNFKKDAMGNSRTRYVVGMD